jgi:hypothetical protein
MLKLLHILLENNILIPRRSKEERSKNFAIILNKIIKQYVENGSRGHLKLDTLAVVTLPDYLTKVGGTLNLTMSSIKSLPNNLQIKKDLELGYAPITELPKNLTIGGSLKAYHSKLESIPNDTKIGKDVDLSNTPITSLPEELYVTGNLRLSHTKITSLPNGLKVEESLYLRNTPITSLPEDLQVEGGLWISDTPLAKKSDEEIRAMLKTGYIRGQIKR